MFRDALRPLGDSALREKLAAGTWTNDYPLWASTAKSLGLPNSTDMPDQVLQLLNPCACRALAAWNISRCHGEVSLKTAWPNQDVPICSSYSVNPLRTRSTHRTTESTI